MLWSKATASVRGTPRPYANVPKETIKRLHTGLKIARKVPIPYQSESNFSSGLLLLNPDREKEVIEKGLCAYCGLGFLDDELCTIWITYPEERLFTETTRVFSDHFPFHVECMKETRIFCPHMNRAHDFEFKIGPYKDLLLESKNYKSKLS